MGAVQGKRVSHKEPGTSVKIGEGVMVGSEGKEVRDAALVLRAWERT